MKKITKLTDEQKARFVEWSKKWIDIGLSTEPADFDAATNAALKAYKLCNLDKPMVILRVDSPYAATIGGFVAWIYLKELAKHFKLKGKVGAQVAAQVRDQVGAQVAAQVWDQVGAQVGDQVAAQVRAQVRAQVAAQVRAQVGAQVWDQVGAQVGAQVRAQVGDQVWDQVAAQVRAQVGAQVRAQVGAQVGDQVAAQVRAQVGDQVAAQVRAQVWAQVGDVIYNDGIASLWSANTAWLTYFRDVCGLEIELSENLEINEALVKSCGWTWWHQNVLAISDRPEVINRDAEGRLHNATGPSIAYRDGWSLYHWHGVSIPAEWVTGKRPTAKQALTWKNIEQRRAAAEIVGWHNILSELNAKVIDEDADPEVGTLLEADIPDSGKERFIQVRCGTGRTFCLPVPRESKTALEANLWTYGIDADRNFLPEIRT